MAEKTSSPTLTFSRALSRAAERQQTALDPLVPYWRLARSCVAPLARLDPGSLFEITWSPVAGEAPKAPDVDSPRDEVTEIDAHAELITAMAAVHGYENLRHVIGEPGVLVAGFTRPVGLGSVRAERDLARYLGFEVQIIGEDAPAVAEMQLRPIG